MRARDGWRVGVGSLDGLLLVLVESKPARLKGQIPRVRHPAGVGEVGGDVVAVVGSASDGFGGDGLFF